MRIGVLGTGTVGRTIATKLVELGHEVRMGSRAAGNEAATAWSDGLGDSASEGTFADAAGFGELAFNCTAGTGALDAVGSASEALEGKLLIWLRMMGSGRRVALQHRGATVSRPERGSMRASRPRLGTVRAWATTSRNPSCQSRRHLG